MDTQKSQFNRILLIILAVLYLLTLAAFIFANYAAEPDFQTWWKLLLNIPILSIPLVLLYGSIYVLVIAWREHSTLGQVNPRLAKIIHWAPRVAAILIISYLLPGLIWVDGVFLFERIYAELVSLKVFFG